MRRSPSKRIDMQPIFSKDWLGEDFMPSITATRGAGRLSMPASSSIGGMPFNLSVLTVLPPSDKQPKVYGFYHHQKLSEPYDRIAAVSCQPLSYRKPTKAHTFRYESSRENFSVLIFF
ncbi:MAG: hypothetical protein R3D88_08745 [Alphaproteobacteria bacterium]